MAVYLWNTINPVFLTASVLPFFCEDNMYFAHNEQIFLDSIKRGYLFVCKSGKIWRLYHRGRNNKDKAVVPTLCGWIGGDGYRVLEISIKGKKYGCRGHRLIWIYFNGPIPDGLEINHINAIRSDNRLENLEVVTQRSIPTIQRMMTISLLAFLVNVI